LGLFFSPSPLPKDPFGGILGFFAICASTHSSSMPVFCFVRADNLSFIRRPMVSGGGGLANALSLKKLGGDGQGGGWDCPKVPLCLSHSLIIHLAPPGLHPSAACGFWENTADPFFFHLPFGSTDQTFAFALPSRIPPLRFREWEPPQTAGAGGGVWKSNGSLVLFFEVPRFPSPFDLRWWPGAAWF